MATIAYASFACNATRHIRVAVAINYEKNEVHNINTSDFSSN
jgi:hypothetical protein